MKQKIITFICIILFLFCSGCTDIFSDLTTSKITYESHPIEVKYSIQYGYQILLKGTGDSTISYREDLPEITKGTISSIRIENQSQAKIRQIGNNEMIFWNETFQDDHQVFFGINADIISSSTMINDLDGAKALNLSEIADVYPNLVESYCSSQGNETKIFIDPSEMRIQQVATTIKENTKTENSVQLAKNLFIWLKTNTSYQIHTKDQQIQTCDQTFSLKTGDCDDLSFLYISLCRAIQLPARFIRGFLLSDQDGIMMPTPHVWVEVFVGNNLGTNGWMPVECAGTGTLKAMIHQNFGIEDAHHLRLYVDDGSNDSMTRYTKHISVTYDTQVTIDIAHHSEITAYQILESKQLCITDDSYREFC